MFRPSRNFKVPLVYGGQWKNHQTFQKWDPIAKRLVQVGCCGPTATTQQSCDTSWYPTFGYLIYEQHLDVYPIGPVYFWCNSLGIVENPPVPAPDYDSGTGKATRCGVEYTVLGVVSAYKFTRVSGSIGVDPGSGNFTSNISPPNIVLQFNKTDKNSNDASSYLSTISGIATTLTITKDSSNYSIFNISGSTDFGTYWSFSCTISSFLGIVNVGDTVVLTYT
jgi:hypothetical protein